MTSVGALVVLSCLGSTISLYRITEVNRLLDAINKVSVPLGRLFGQMQSDADVLRRELDRGLGYSHWSDPHWRPRPVPRWIEDVLQGEVDRMGQLIRSEGDWTTDDSRKSWQDWADGMNQKLKDLRAEAAKLYTALDQKDETAAMQIYPRWTANMEDWRRQVQWGSSEYERMLRQTFALAEARVAELRTGLELILGTVVLLSFLLLWLGERALRPLADLTRLAREIANRGLRKEDKALLPDLHVSRTDEVSALAREFHRMATTLLEREKTVDQQKHRLQEQNRMLREMGELNQNILNSIDSVLLVTDLNGRITQCNPGAEKWLDSSLERIIGSELVGWDKLIPLGLSVDSLARGDGRRLGPVRIDDRTVGGHLMPLVHEPHGAIIVLEDLTEELDLQERLRRAENLAAVGRMSAQVAHEVRNPLHSIGLEAEMAAEMAAGLGQPALKQSLSSILGAVDRLEKITDNYLKLSRLSAGEKGTIDLGDVLMSVLATYANVCEAQKIQVDWQRAPGSSLLIRGDRDLLEQVLGNLMRNAIQALETRPHAGSASRIRWQLATLESGRSWLRIEDNGPGIAAEIREKLFTPFLTTRAQGTGLGLSFVKQVVEDHGGTITLSEGAGGACFDIVFPSLAEAGAGPNLVLETEQEEVVADA